MKNAQSCFQASVVLVVATLASLCIPHAALACAGCTDNALKIRYPFVSPLILLFFVWIAVTAVIRWYSRRRGEFPQELPGGKRFARYATLGTVAIILSFLFMVPRSLGFLVVLIWFVALLVTSVAGLFRTPRSAAMKLYLTLNLLILLSPGAILPVSYANARSSAGMVASLGNPVHGLCSSLLIPGLIRKGEGAVPLLIHAIEKEIQQRAGWSHSPRVAQMCFCLGKIGGSESETYLGNLVRARIRLTEWADRRYGIVACCAYAECAGKRAIPDLARIYASAAGEEADLQQAAVLCAMVRTGSREGVVFALEKARVLLSCITQDMDHEMAYAAKGTFAAIVRGRNADHLKSCVIYAKIWGGVDQRAVTEAFGEPSAPSPSNWGDGQQPNVDEVAETWPAKREELMSRWTGVLE